MSRICCNYKPASKQVFLLAASSVKTLLTAENPQLRNWRNVFLCYSYWQIYQAPKLTIDTHTKNDCHKFIT